MNITTRVTHPKPAAEWRFVWCRHPGQHSVDSREETRVSASFAADMPASYRDMGPDTDDIEVPNNFTVEHQTGSGRSQQMRFTRDAAEALRDALTAALEWG